MGGQKNTHKLVVVLLKDGIVDNVLEILLVTLGEIKHRLRVAERGVLEALAVRVLADAF